MFFLAQRYLLSRKKQSVLILLGIVLGTTAYVIISGMMLGFQTHIVDQLVNNDAQVRISSKQEFVTEQTMKEEMYQDTSHVFWIIPPSGRRDYDKIEYPYGWFARLEKEPRVLAYSPQLTSQVILRRGVISKPARLIGSEPQKQERVTNIRAYMVEGKFQDVGSSGNRLVVGDSLLESLGSRVTESILVSSGDGKPVPFKIVGKFHTGIKSIDDGTAFGALSDIQKVNLTPSRITDIAVRLVDVKDADALALQWRSISKEKVQSWSESNEGILSVFQTQDFVRNFMTVSILIVAGFGIYNILNMMVGQKRREIAILRSMGYERDDIVRLFLIQGFIFGLIGGLVGIAIGYLGSKYISTIPISKDRMISGPGNTMPFSFDAIIYIKGFFLAFVSCVFASFLPARAAGELTPIQIIRSEGG